MTSDLLQRERSRVEAERVSPLSFAETFTVPPVETSERRPSLASLLQALRRRRRFIGLSVLACTAPAALLVLQLEPRYEAEALLIWSPPWLETQFAGGSGGPGPVTGVVDPNVIRSVTATLASDQMVRRVVADARLQTLPEFSPCPSLGAQARAAAVGLLGAVATRAAPPIAGLAASLAEAIAPAGVGDEDQERLQIAAAVYRRALTVANDSRSYAISVAFRAEDRELAAAIANRHAELYVAAEREAKSLATADAREWLDREVRRLSERLRRTESALWDYRERTRLPPTGAAARPAGSERQETALGELEREISATRGVYEALLTRQKEFAARESPPQADVRLISRAIPPLRPSGPDRGLLLLLAALGAFVSAAGSVLARDALRSGFATAAELEAATGLRVLSTIPRAPGRAGLPGLVTRRPGSAVAEAVRSLRAALTLACAPDERPRTLAVVSALPGEGRTSLALALARSLARTGLKVLLVETDFRNPALARLLWDDAPLVGLVDVLKQEIPLSEALRDDPESDLKLLVAPEPRGVEAPDLLGSAAMRELLATASASFDYVILDTPALGPVLDAALVARLARAALVVVRSERSPGVAVQRAIRALQDAGAPVVGAVLSGVDPRWART